MNKIIQGLKWRQLDPAWSSKRSSARIQDSVSTTPAKVLKGSSSATGARVSAENLKEKEAANGELSYQLVHPCAPSGMLSHSQLCYKQCFHRMLLKW